MTQVGGLSVVLLEERRIAILRFRESDDMRALDPRYEHVRLREWRLPSDEAFRVCIEEIVAWKIDALAFASPQVVVELFTQAQAAGVEDEVRLALREGIVVAAADDACWDELTRIGIKVHAMPREPTVGRMMVCLARCLEDRLTPATNSVA